MIKLNKTLGENYTNDLDDVRNVKNALNRIGHYDVPDYGLTKYPDKKLFDGIRDFQKKENLSIDGTMKPYGETLVALNKKITDDPGVKSPTMRCKECGGWHGGSQGDLCPLCASK